MSHLPERVLNFKNPRARPYYSGYRKRKKKREREREREMCGISCHKYMKFLHAIAEVCLYLMHKN
jgi:hypothetical protein